MNKRNDHLREKGEGSERKRDGERERERERERGNIHSFSVNDPFDPHSSLFTV